MDPVSSNTQSSNCSDPISSNCVISQMNSLPCINLCTPATQTQVDNAIGGVVCNLITQLNSIPAPVTIPIIDFSQLNLGCLWLPTTTTWTCPAGETFLPDSSALSVNGTPGFCQSCPSVGPCFLTFNTPTMVTVPNPTPKPTTLLGIMQLIINAIPCCDPCSKLNPGT